LRNVSYAERPKTLARRISGAPTFYVLGEPHAADNAILKFLRRLTAFARGRRNMDGSR
jgi:hypothetical protein